MRILALDSAVSRCSATLLAGGVMLAGFQQDLERGHASVLPVMADDCLRNTGIAAASLDLIAVTIGPGSFTGIRGGIAFAQGLALAASVPLVGVTVGEALADSLPNLGERLLWVVTPSRRGHIFLEIGPQVLSLALAELPNPSQKVAVAGGVAAEIASRLAARGVDVMLTDARRPTGRHIAAVAERRFLGLLPLRAATPLYVDPPLARPQSPRREVLEPPDGAP